MTPEKKKVINGHKIEEFYWAGRYVVYIDNHLFEGSFDKAVKSVQ